MEKIDDKEIQKKLDRIGKLFDDMSLTGQEFGILLSGDPVLQRVFWTCYLLIKDSDIRKNYTYQSIKGLLKTKSVISIHKIRRAIDILDGFGLVKYTSMGLHGQPTKFIIVNLRGYLKYMDTLEESLGSKEKSSDGQKE
jgi:hypothetical protein